MSSGKTPYHFVLLKQKYRLLRGIEILLWSVAMGWVSFYTLKTFNISLYLSLGISCLLGVIAIVIGVRKTNVYNIKEKDLALYINRRYPQLEESADLLLLNDQELTSLQLLQKSKIIHQLEAIYPSIKLPHHVGRAIAVFAFGIIICTGLIAFSIHQKGNSESALEKINNSEKKLLPAFIKNAAITISPPSYTGLKKRTTADFNLLIPEGSIVEWRITFEGNTINPKLIFSGRDSINLAGIGNEFQLAQNFKEPGFYQITWTTADGLKQYSDYYKIEVIKDHPPAVSIKNLSQFLELDPTDNLQLHLKSSVTDDYGLNRAHIIATVSKGSGEAIKFREEKLDFESPKKMSGKSVEARRTIDLLKLGLLPGDELYFYVEAFDIRKPEPNRSRTETYFISIQDTSSIETSIDAGFGVDLMPEYFRSQRQIIIDSEKLLKEKKHISKQNFNARSNELGYDQKVLRLRYGEFLGEEFESGIGPQHTVQRDEDEDVTKKLGHDHDKGNEHNRVEEKKGVLKDYTHDQKESGVDKEDPMKEYVHAHDSNEEATFFVQSIKAKLKAAITIMWDAELYLRLYQPEKSLPYQYKALKLLKEISQDSRIYVHRTGFDPPPLKEEKRLTGDLSEIENSVSNDPSEKAEPYPLIKEGLRIIEKLLQDDSLEIISFDKNRLIKAGQEMASLAVKQPGRYLKTLSLLKTIIHDQVQPEKRREMLVEIRTAFWNVLPSETVSPQAKSGINHELDLLFLKNLEASKQNK